ncbi:hypothetical protein F4808DRAFT_465644 [Astrocystis sublimbata]|nr:hypothetical protein F4808DRAFT_465644 [Astrocystis sublimbata]
MNLIANACGIYCERYARLHTWLGIVVVIKVVLHTILAVKQTDFDGPDTPPGFHWEAARTFTQRHRALIEGPYGRSLSLGEYGTVLLLATGVGIAGQLPYVKELLELYKNCQAKTRRVVLFWELDTEVHRHWVKDWMDELLALDRDYILDMQLYIPGRFLSRRASENTVKKLGTHGRITLNYAAMRADQLIASEIAERKGRTLVLFRTRAITTRTVIEVV